MISIRDQLNPKRLEQIHSLRQGLNDETVEVPVNYEGRKQVAFAEDQPVRISARRYLLPQLFSSEQPRCPEVVIYWRAVKREHSKRDLRPRTVQRAAKHFASRADNSRNPAGGDPVGGQQIASVYP
jgi:hypothetical protein